MSDQSQDPEPAMASSAAQLYDSLPIPQSSQFIRVLDILEKSSATDPGLTGSLRLVDLNDSPKFTALSYVWGKASGKSINCNGYEVKVTDSCFEALSSLREALGNFTIWVDAICINQMDDDEKTTQILLMDEVYTWAEAVYICPRARPTTRAFLRPGILLRARGPNLVEKIMDFSRDYTGL
ncbi:hypothetical protein CEP54_008927 [Fusarium duplospermum]|uniref:Heterokaryon incompatibility domain-containing protein n=1 Tax=Fusarium duplospermum TaxID=1325734 RepID=A0A428PT40_9HYPO|nr:hypothetical protein CEP54_008927 [Fusarium duplospermum]